MNKIVIAIPTYKRPDMLTELLQSILKCRIDSSLISEVNIIVVDNDIDKTAEYAVSNLTFEKTELKSIVYHNFIEKGLSNVRNEMLRKGFESSPDFIVFIDDDEFVTIEWLNELIKTMINNDADLARGPVFAKMTDNTPEKISCWFTRENFPNNKKLYTLASGNLIMRRTSLQKFGIWFDKRFNSTGSEDSFFGIQLLKKGAKIFWAANAVTYETIPESRTTLSWLLKRNYRVAGTFTYILKVENQSLKLVKKTIVSLIYILIGFLGIIFMLLPIKKRYWGILKLSEGLGGISGLGNKIYSEYK
ncbi:MAG: glycosyltransferase family 2 protein [Paludibacter sp.]|nr:glycosyltransferase family 2 protein [Paludibacter sp.]